MDPQHQNTPQDPTPLNRFDPNVNPDDLPEHQPDEAMTAEQQEAEKQERIAYLQSLTPPKKPRKPLVKVLVILALVAVIGGGAAAYFLLTPKDDNKTAETTTTPQQATATPVVDKPVTATETFNSTAFGLAINYPKNWTPAETTGKLTITSPAMKLVGSDQKTMTGEVVVTLVAKGQGLGAFTEGNGTAVLDSQKLTYTAPTSVQRAQTYLSFVQYPATTTLGALDALYVTGDYGYLKGQAVPLVDLQKLDPVISVTFLKCTDATCATAAAAPIASSNWTDKIFSTPIQTTIESLAINE